MLRQRPDIMGEHDAPGLGGPFQNGRIVRTRKPNVLRPHDVKTRTPPPQSAHDPAVKVLVREQREH
jgi:hypothetical protein